MLTIYGVYRSRAIRPLWVLEECQAPYSHVPVIQAYRLADPASHSGMLHTAMPDYLAINPLGQVPAMRDGPLLLSESLAICLHIARKYGGTIGPASDDEASVMEQWALFAATAVEPAAIEILYTTRDGQADTPTGQGIIRLAAEKLKRPLARIERSLTDSPWLIGRFTVADIMVAECLRYAQSHGALLADYPLTARWLSAAQARPAFQTVWAKRAAEPE